MAPGEVHRANRRCAHSLRLPLPARELTGALSGGAAFDSNLHCLAFTIFHVMATMEWVTTDRVSGGASGWEDRPIMSAVSARCEDFVSCAATTIVRCASDAAMPGKSGYYAVGSMYIFLDKVHATSLAPCGGACPTADASCLQFAAHVGEAVPRSSIERVLPYDLIRSAYLSAYEAGGLLQLDLGLEDPGTPTPIAAGGN